MVLAAADLPFRPPMGLAREQLVPDRPLRLLVVDDHQPIREVLALLLRDEGFEVQEAADGLAALAVLKRWPADLILLDLMMPIMDGWEFLEAQRAISGVARIPVIVLSASRVLSQRELRAPEGVAVLPKPFDFQLVVKTIRRLLYPRSRRQPAPRRGLETPL